MEGWKCKRPSGNDQSRSTTKWQSDRNKRSERSR